jgi:serine/threonine protein kinase
VFIEVLSLVGIDDESKQKVAIKMIQKSLLTPKLEVKLQMEIENMKKLRGHPNIIELIDVIEVFDSTICMII